MDVVMRERFDSPAFFRDKDIYNDRQRIRDLALVGLSPTQAWITISQDDQLHHTIKYDDEHRVEAVFWTYP
ncbi:hypothetical protein E4U26_007387 [Claviceps purpurea]|nr:hypothetical protein E4U26_007387 [Claviceps purpurea]KAG6293546.1 hypothetical protein E4U45_006599 [Claviceps purpurea]